MPGRNSGVYLVSASRHGDMAMTGSEYDNQAYDHEKQRELSKADYEQNERAKNYSDKPYRGMGKDELLYHSSKPFWRNLRMFCVAFVLLAWLALIGITIALIIVYPKCKDPPPRSWWQQSPIYRVYTRSFQDSNNDGIGDIQGLTDRIDYIKSLGVKIISMSSVYQSGGGDRDFDITDHTKIDAEYGTMADFDALVNATHDAGMFLIMDFIPNHTSDKHPWFIKSKTDPDYKNYYVWNEATTPNNWVNMYGGSAWTWNSDRNESYLHQYSSSEPDLNIRSSIVQDELKMILQFWLDKGVDGFYVRRSAYLFEDYDLRDEVKAVDATTTDPNSYSYYNHEFTFALREVYDVLSRWRYYLDEYKPTGADEKSNKELLMFADINGQGNIQSVMNYYGYFGAKCTNFPVNTEFFDASPSNCDGKCVSEKTKQWEDNSPTGSWPNWLSGLDDNSRIASRGGENFTRAFQMLSILLPGTPIVYAGDEIGLKDVTLATGLPVGSRTQPWRSPMLWNTTSLGGFCEGSCTPWIALNPNPADNGVQNQTEDDASLLNYMTSLLALREEPSFQHGEYIRTLEDENVISFVREWDGEEGYMVAINFGTQSVQKDYTTKHSTVVSSAAVALTTGSTSYSVDNSADMTSLKLEPLDGVVVKWDYVAKDL